jgi:peptide/nickel transport system permease protein
MAVSEQPVPGSIVHSGPTRWEKIKEAVATLFRSRIAVVGLFLVGFWLILAIFADNCIISPGSWATCAVDTTDPGVSTPWLARYSPFEQFRGENLKGPSADHWLGTDRNGRDLWARLIHGGRTIFLLAPASVVIALVVGGTLGVVSGYFGGAIDETITQALNVIMSFPQILLYLVIIAALGPSVANVVLAITIAGTPGIARLVRGLTLDIKTRDYVAAAQTRGESSLYIMFVEILPNARGPIIIDAMLRVGYAIFSIGTLGFLGLGLPPPSPDWGSMVASGKSFIQAGHPWDALFASAAIAMVVVGLNLIADGVSEETSRYR